MRHVSLPLVFMLGLAGCGVGMGRPTVEELAVELDCGQLVLDERPDAGTEESGECILDDSTVILYTFRSPDSARRFLETTKMWEDSDPHLYPQGDTWVAEVTTRDVARRVADALNGMVD